MVTINLTKKINPITPMGFATAINNKDIDFVTCEETFWCASASIGSIEAICKSHGAAIKIIEYSCEKAYVSFELA